MSTPLGYPTASAPARAHHASAVAFWTDPDDEGLVTHAYVVIESVALVRSRLGLAAVAALMDELLPALRVEMVDRPLHQGPSRTTAGSAAARAQRSG